LVRISLYKTKGEQLPIEVLLHDSYSQKRIYSLRKGSVKEKRKETISDEKVSSGKIRGKSPLRIRGVPRVRRGGNQNISQKSTSAEDWGNSSRKRLD